MKTTGRHTFQAPHWPSFLKSKPGRMVVEVFKTNVRDERQARKLIVLILEHDPFARVNFDLDDCDRILRVASNRLSPVQVILILTKEGFECGELDS